MIGGWENSSGSFCGGSFSRVPRCFWKALLGRFPFGRGWQLLLRWVHDAEKAAAARTGDSIGAHLAPQDAEAA